MTGATGYLGGGLARRLREAGHEVRAVVRATSHAEPLRQIGVATFEGDITDRYSLREGMSGADWVVHAAADLDLNGPAERMRRINVEGSDNVASLAYKLGVGRFLSVSSVASFGGSPPDGTAVDETAPLLPPPTRYSATKRAGGEAIRQWERRGLAVNTVYPGLVYGPPGEKKGANAILRQVVLERMPLLVAGDRRMSWVYLDDVVDALLRILEQAEPGRGYILAGEVATLGSVIERTAALAGVRPPRPRVPLAAAKLLLALSLPLYRLRGRRRAMGPGQLRSLERHWAFDDTRARRELDWHPRSLESGLPPTVEMLRAS